MHDRLLPQVLALDLSPVWDPWEVWEIINGVHTYLQHGSAAIANWWGRQPTQLPWLGRGMRPTHLMWYVLCEHLCTLERPIPVTGNLLIRGPCIAISGRLERQLFSVFSEHISNWPASQTPNLAAVNRDIYTTADSPRVLLNSNYHHRITPCSILRFKLPLSRKNASSTRASDHRRAGIWCIPKKWPGICSISKFHIQKMMASHQHWHHKFKLRCWQVTIASLLAPKARWSKIPNAGICMQLGVCVIVSQQTTLLPTHWLLPVTINLWDPTPQKL